MKLRVIFVSLLSVVLSASASTGSPRTHPDDKDKEGQKVERRIAVDAAVAVSLCVTSGNITVRGWDRNEVAARSIEAAQIELKQPAEMMPSASIKKLEVVVVNKEMLKLKGKCQAYSDVELNVPRGATVLVQTRDGDISIAEVASAYAGTQNGDIEIAQVSRTIEVGSIGGGISLKDSRGRVSASSAGGSIEAANLRPVEPGDSFDVVTASGDINLSQVTHKQINTKTVSGNLTMTGPLAAGGKYWFNSFSGDVTLALPSSSSFKLIAKVSEDGEIITDFPLTLTQSSAPTPAEQPHPPTASSGQTPPAPPAPPKASATVITPKGGPAVKVHVKPVVTVSPVITVTPTPKIAFTMRRVSGIHGTGDATISVASFSGTLRLEQN